MAGTGNMEIKWWARRLARRLGIWGAAGLLLAAVVPVILVGGVLPLQREVADLRGRLALPPAQPITTAPAVTPEQSLSADLDAFQARFPSRDQLSDQLDILFELAAKHGLVVDKGEYALVEKAGGMLRRFEVTLPVTGNYLQVCALMMEALGKLPAVALSDVTLEREKIADGRVRANLRLVFFVRKGAS